MDIKRFIIHTAGGTAIALSCFSIAPGYAQFSFRDTVGTDFEYQFTLGTREATALGRNIIRNNSILKGASFQPGQFASRHNRQGENTGIGSSFLQTTSPTSEGSPALLQSQSLPVIQTINVIPNTAFSSSSSFTSPALSGTVFRPLNTEDNNPFAIKQPTAASNMTMFHLPAESQTPQLEDLNFMQ